MGEAPLEIIYCRLYVLFKATAARMQVLNKRQEVSTIEEKGTNDKRVVGARFDLVNIYIERF